MEKPSEEVRRSVSTGNGTGHLQGRLKGETLII